MFYLFIMKNGCFSMDRWILLLREQYFSEGYNWYFPDVEIFSRSTEIFRDLNVCIFSSRKVEACP